MDKASDVGDGNMGRGQLGDEDTDCRDNLAMKTQIVGYGRLSHNYA